MSDDVASLKQMLRIALQQLADIRGGVASHVHRCPDGHEWICTSPYCDAIVHPCLEHDGGPLGRPPDYAVEPRYAREALNA
jgi:hypothetical protein